MKISIITATYNSSATIADTMKSVLNQSYKNIDYIIVDGGSTDNTMEIVERYRTRFGMKLRSISEPDNGIYDAMNKGIKLACGDVVGILNSDDFYTSSDVLERVSQVMEDANVDAVYGDVHYVHNGALDKCTRYYSSSLFQRNLIRFGLIPAHPSFYCRREIYEKYGLFDLSYKVAADFENLLRLIFVHRIRTKYIPMDFVTMRVGGASTSGLKSHIQIMKDHLRALRSHGVYSNMCFLCLRYPYKIYEVVMGKLKGKI